MWWFFTISYCLIHLFYVQENRRVQPIEFKSWLHLFHWCDLEQAILSHRISILSYKMWKVICCCQRVVKAGLCEMMSVKHFVCVWLSYCGSQVVAVAIVGINNLSGKCWKICGSQFVCSFVFCLKLVTPFVPLSGYWSIKTVGVELGVVGWDWGISCTKVLLEDLTGWRWAGYE